jgi:hypothetical protein
MSTEKPKTAIVNRHDIVLDWFEVKPIELSLESASYEFQYRFGPGWYLEATHYTGEKWLPVVWPGRDRCFRICDPAEALVALGDRVTKFTCISTGMQFHKALAQLMERADKIRARQEQNHD